MASRGMDVWLMFLQIASSAVVFVNGFNMDVFSPIVQSVPYNESYFGYSVEMHRESGVNKILVGAPRYQTDDVNITRGGAVFDCPVQPYTNTPSCQELTQFNGQGSDYDDQGEKVADQSGQWFGATVKSSGEDGTIVACRPLYSWYTLGTLGTLPLEKRPIGGCYVARNNFTTIETYEPCRGVSNLGLDGISLCQAGFKADINEDEILLGAPGSTYWQGQGWKVNHNLTNGDSTSAEAKTEYDNNYRGYAVAIANFKGDSSTQYALGAPRGESLFGMVTIYDGSWDTKYETLIGEQTNSYFGHSLAVSDFNNDNFDDLVVGAPMFINEKTFPMGWETGQVYIYYNDGNGGFNQPAVTILGKEMKSRFGYTLAALTDVNLDGYNDLAISAPYGGDSGDGVVYIYYGEGNNGLSLTESQTLKPSSFGLSLSTFGYSLAAGMDMDENMYPDLVIGAYSSATVIMVRSRPVVYFNASMVPSPSSIKLADTTFTVGDGSALASFNVSVCIEYTGMNVPASLDMNVEVALESDRVAISRALFDLEGDDESYFSETITLASNENSCKSYVAYIKSSIEDKVSPIGVSLTVSLSDDTPPAGTILPILHEEANTVTKISLPLQTNCQNETCVPDLSVQASTVGSLVVGDSETVTIFVTMANTGEDAYQAVLTLHVPEELQYVDVTEVDTDQVVTCTSNPQNLEVTCDVGNPFNAKSSAEVKFQFSSDNLPGNKNELLFTISISSFEEDGSTDDNEFNVTVPLTVDAELSLYGSSNPADVVFEEATYPLTRTITYEEDVGPEINHKFELYNNGPSSVGETEVLIRWPMKYDAGDKSYLLYLMNVTMDTGDSCSIVGDGEFNPENLESISSMGTTPHPPTQQSADSSSNVIVTEEDISCTDDQLQYCYTVRCVAGSLDADSNVIITARSRVWTNTLFENTLDLSVFVEAQAEVLSVPYVTQLDKPIEATSNEVLTKINPEYPSIATGGGSTPAWAYIVAVLGGALMLALLIVTLYCTGFFKKKEIGDDDQRTEIVHASADITDIDMCEANTK